MKKTLNSIIALVLILSAMLALTACSIDTVWGKMPWNKETPNTEKLWDSATYPNDREFGKGAKTLTVKVEQGENSVTFTIHTDKETVGEALIEHGIVEGEAGPYGLYIKRVNGITADYDIDQSYWSFYLGESYAMSGVDTTQIEEGIIYRLVYTK